jgi:hypothetical protein
LAHFYQYGNGVGLDAGGWDSPSAAQLWGIVPYFHSYRNRSAPEREHEEISVLISNFKLQIEKPSI